MSDCDFRRVYNDALKTAFRYAGIPMGAYILVNMFDLADLLILTDLFGIHVGCFAGVFGALISAIKNKASIKYILFITLLNPFFYGALLFIPYSIDIYRSYF